MCHKYHVKHIAKQCNLDRLKSGLKRDTNEMPTCAEIPEILFRVRGSDPWDLGSKREDRFSNPFFEVVQKTCQVHFSYLLRLGNFCKGPRTLRKFPQKCQKIARCWGRAVYARNLRSPRHLAHPLQNDPVQTILRVNHGLTQRAHVTPLLVLCLAFFNKKSVTKRK